VLKANRVLLVERAFHTLQRCGDRLFSSGATFEQIIDLRKFHVDLRRLVLQALDASEISVRAVITYEVGKDLGVFGYADRANFAAAFNHADFMKILR